MSATQSNVSSGEPGIDPQREIFRIALERLKPPRWLVIVEIILWTILAVYLGVCICNFLTARLHGWVFKCCYWTIIALTPFVIGAWVNRVHFVPGTDEALRAIPLQPDQIIGPMFRAVIFTFIRLFAPILILAVISHELAFAELTPSMWVRVYWWASAWLTQFPYICPIGYTSFMWAPGTSYIEFTPTIETGVIVVLAILQTIGWFFLPVAWGFYWRTRQSQPSVYWFAYFSYMLMPITLAALNFGWSSSGYQLQLTLYNLGLRPAGVLKWPWILIAGLGGVIVSVVMYKLALRAWGRGKP